MNSDYDHAEAAAQFLLAQTALRPAIGLVLGSGLGGFADDLSEATRIPYANIPSFPRSGTAVGHAGQMVMGKVGEHVPGSGDAGAGAFVRRLFRKKRSRSQPACLAGWGYALSS